MSAALRLSPFSSNLQSLFEGKAAYELSTFDANEQLFDCEVVKIVVYARPTGQHHGILRDENALAGNRRLSIPAFLTCPLLLNYVFWRRFAALFMDRHRRLQGLSQDSYSTLFAGFPKCPTSLLIVSHSLSVWLRALLLALIDARELYSSRPDLGRNGAASTHARCEQLGLSTKARYLLLRTTYFEPLIVADDQESPTLAYPSVTLCET